VFREIFSCRDFASEPNVPRTAVIRTATITMEIDASMRVSPRWLEDGL
jgi:hypothetical protein